MPTSQPGHAGVVDNQLARQQPERTDRLRLWLLRSAGVTSAVGHGCTFVVLPIYLVEQLGGGAAAIALGMLGTAMSFSFLIGGQVADRASRVKTMVLSDVVRAVATLAYLVPALHVLGAGAVVVVAGAAFTNGLAVGFFRPALAALWPDVIAAAEFRRTLATTSFLNRIGLLAGSSLGGMLIALHMTAGALLLDGCTFVVSALLLSRRREPGRAAAAVSTLDFRAAMGLLNLRRSIRELHGLAGRLPWLRRLLLGANAFSLFQAASGILLPVFVIAKFGNGVMAIYQTIPALCLIVGSLLARHTGARLPGVIYCGGSLFLSTAWLLAVVTSAPAPTIAAAAVGYVCTAWAEPLWTTAIIDVYGAQERGRVFAAMQSSGLLLAPAGSFAAAVLLASTSAGNALIGMALAGMLAAVLPLTARGGAKMLPHRAAVDAVLTRDTTARKQR